MATERAARVGVGLALPGGGSAAEDSATASAASANTFGMPKEFSARHIVFTGCEAMYVVPPLSSKRRCSDARHLPHCCRRHVRHRCVNVGVTTHQLEVLH